MSFRICKQETRERATAELLSILEKVGPLSTSELSGTPQFHGARTLSNRQIIRLLRESGKAEMEYGGNQRFSYGIWRLKGDRRPHVA
jgi:hypothetical protein